MTREVMAEYIPIIKYLEIGRRKNQFHSVRVNMPHTYTSDERANLTVV